MTQPSDDTGIVDQAMTDIFFAFRALTKQADALLLAHGLGRAHYRAMHVVSHQPGCSVLELTATLGVTLQSSNRVLNDLKSKAYLRVDNDDRDKRKRLLSLTQAGANAFEEAFATQVEVIRRAIGRTDTTTFQLYHRFVRAIIESADG